MDRQVFRGSWVWLRVLALLCLLAAACSRTPPEQALRNSVAEMQAAVDKKDFSVIEEHLAEDFIGPEGLDRTGARRMAQGMFLRYRDVDVKLGPLKVALQDEHATVRFTAAVVAGGNLLPENAQVYDVTTGWRLADGEWRLVNANWKWRL